MNTTTHLAGARIGVDIGRVIIAGDGPDTSFVGGSDEDALRAPAVPGAFESLTRLTRALEGRVWLVSKCGPRVQARTRVWLDHHRFFESTGIARDQVRFCRERRDKAPICAALGIGCFVDDRVDVLDAMAGVVPWRILFGATAAPSPHLLAAAGWAEVEALLTARLGLTRSGT